MPDTSHSCNWVPQERAAVIAYYLVTGESLTTRRIAEITGLTLRGAEHLMDRLSRVLPVYRDDKLRWQVCK